MLCLPYTSVYGNMLVRCVSQKVSQVRQVHLLQDNTSQMYGRASQKVIYNDYLPMHIGIYLLQLS